MGSRELLNTGEFLLTPHKSTKYNAISLCIILHTVQVSVLIFTYVNFISNLDIFYQLSFIKWFLKSYYSGSFANNLLYNILIAMLILNKIDIGVIHTLSILI